MLAPSGSLDRLWEATRPADPTAAQLDALWAHASAELDRIDAAGRSGAIPWSCRSPARGG